MVPIWRKVAPTERGRLINRLADLMERDKEDLATLDALDNDKSFVVARDVDLIDFIACYQYFAGWADKIHGKTIDTIFDKVCYTRHEPLGIVGAVIPWNYPTMMAAWKFAPALAAANCRKVSAFAAVYFLEAGFPPAVVNIIPGYGHTTGAYLSSHCGVSKMAFTGLTVTGRKIMEASSSSNLKELQLELGGKSAQIVCADADLKQAAEWACGAIFNNHGQSCNAGSRILVHESVPDKFVELFIEHAKKMIKIGDPFDPDTFQGPQISKAQFDKIMGYIEISKKDGAKVSYGGKRWGTKGYYVEPTVFIGCKNSMRIMREEIFGPVVAMATSKTIDEAIEIANDSDYDLAGGVFTQDLYTAMKVVNEVKTGTMWVNCFDDLISQLHLEVTSNQASAKN